MELLWLCSCWTSDPQASQLGALTPGALHMPLLPPLGRHRGVSTCTRFSRNPAPSPAPSPPSSGHGTHIQGRFWGLPCPRQGGPHRACGRVEGQLADRTRAHWTQGLPGHRERVRVVQLGPWGASKCGGVQSGWSRVVGRVQVACRCHLRKERRTWSKGPGLPRRVVPRPLGPALTWPGRLGADFSGARRLLGMSGW